MNKEEFKFEKGLLKLKREILLLEHTLKMERLTFERESNKRFHEMALERERIKSAEIRKSQLRKEEINFMKNH